MKMMRFTGTTEARIDAKGRVFFPATFRKVLASEGEESLMLTRDAFQPCLVVYPGSVWYAQLDELSRSLSRWNARERMIMREISANVEPVTLDGGGRILIPARYASHSGIEQDVVFLGMDDCVEIWAPEVLSRSRMSSSVFAGELERLMKKSEQ